ncbi:glycosyltransferase [Chelatococcus sp. GCM10030263]|uniref:glycosyltransferase n=1 Tax=Chelatococcus sp. GCM10030263 TaxID=3273387 RepID=UPI003610DE77
MSDRPQGVIVVVPVLPPGLGEEAAAGEIRRLLSAFLQDADPTGRVLWYYTPMAMAFSRDLRADAVVYDNMDELSAFLGAPPRLLALEQELFARADLVFTGGMSLYAAKSGRHKSVHAFPSSIDAAHFGAARQGQADPDDQAGIARPRIGFFGVIDERMNIDLVREAAELRPDWQFVILGPVVKIDPAVLPRQPNIHWLGPKAYVDLPRYLAHWDAGFMPFALNEATRFISPTKTPEFLAAGVPVVSTAITDVVKPYGERGFVEIADGPAELVAKLDCVLSRPREPWLAEVGRHLQTMSWDKTWAGMLDLIQAAARANGRAQASPVITPVRARAMEGAPHV